MSNPIPTENALTGSTAWTPANVSTTEIQAYCDKQSLDAGSTISFFVSTQVASTTYTVKIFRMGWYGGTGGCLKSTTTGRVGVAQGYWNASNTTLTNCPTAIIDSTTHLTEAGWTVTDTWAVPANAVTGVYVAQFVDANSKMTFCSFVVRGNSPADYVFVRGITTDQAYNDWGGFSLYTATPATKVSFNRPNTKGYGAAGVFDFDLMSIKWLERQGYNLSYLTSVDIHATPSLLLNYKAYISAGHDEYWSKEMRDGVEAALAAQVGLAFFGANACYWQIRFGNDNAGNANKTIICYKVGITSSTVNTLANDPFYGVDNTRVTTQWRKYPVNRPENALIGIMYSSLLSNSGNDVANVAWKTDAAATSVSYVSNGTGLTNSTTYGYDLVGYEYDKQQPNGPTNLQLIATTPVTDVSGVTDWQNTSIYQAPSGAWVFAAGSINLTGALDTYRAVTQGGGTPAEIAGIQTLFTNVLAAVIAPRAKVNSFSGFMAHL